MSIVLISLVAGTKSFCGIAIEERDVRLRWAAAYVARERGFDVDEASLLVILNPAAVALGGGATKFEWEAALSAAPEVITYEFLPEDSPSYRLWREAFVSDVAAVTATREAAES